LRAFSNREKALTKNFYEFKMCSLQRILAEFMRINKNREGLEYVTKRFVQQEAPNKGMKAAG